MPALKVYLQQIFAKLAKSSFIKNVLVVMSGMASLSFALSPIISHLFLLPILVSLVHSGRFWNHCLRHNIGICDDHCTAEEKKMLSTFFFISCLATSVIALLSLVACLLAPTFVMNLMKAPNTWILVMLVLATLV